MDPRKVAIPLLAFAGGAVLARVLGLKTLVRGAMAAAALTGMTRPALGSNGHARVARPRRRKPAHRSARRRIAAKKPASA